MKLDFTNQETIIREDNSNDEQQNLESGTSEAPENNADNEIVKTQDLAAEYFSGKNENLDKVKDSLENEEQSEKDSENSNEEQSEKPNEELAKILEGTNFKTLEDLKKSALSATEKIREQAEQIKNLQSELEGKSNPGENSKGDEAESKSEISESEKAELSDILKVDEDDIAAFDGYLDEDTAKKVVSMLNNKLSKALETIKDKGEIDNEDAQILKEIKAERQSRAESERIVGLFQDSMRQYISENPNMTATEEKAIRSFFRENGKTFNRVFTEKLDDKSEQVNNIKEVLKIAHLAAKGSNVDNYIKVANENADKKVSEMVSAIAKGKVKVQVRGKNNPPKKSKGYTAVDYFAGKNPDRRGSVSLH